MIQRIQTIFLLLAALSMGSLFINGMSFFSLEGTAVDLQNEKQSMLVDGVFDIGDHILLVGICGVIILLSIIAIFQFSNRKRQVKITRISLVLNIVLLILITILFLQDFNKLVSREYVMNGEYGLLSPVLSIIFVLLAIRFIKKDDKLVKSMDRLR